MKVHEMITIILILTLMALYSTMAHSKTCYNQAITNDKTCSTYVITD